MTVEIKTNYAENKPLSIFICEDEKNQLNELVHTVKSLSVKENLITEAFLSANELLKVLETKKPDIILVDIVMPEMDGITLAKKIREIAPDCYLIFTTAYEEYAIKGYEARAFRYLLKPITSEVLGNLLAEVKREITKGQKLLIKTVDGEHIVKLDDVIYISAEDKYSILYTANQHFVDRTSLNEYENLLEPYGFSRVHRKFIVNRIYHKSMGKGTITLSNGVEIAISRRKEKEYRDILFKNMAGEVIK